MSISVGAHDPFDLFPIKDGLRPSKSGLKKLEYEHLEKNNIFQFDDKFHLYRKNKEACRKENLPKYYQTMHESNKDVIIYIIDKLLTQNSAHFSDEFEGDTHILHCHLTGDELHFDRNYNLISSSICEYRDAFDALAMQVQEDLVIQRANEYRDYASDIHLCHANGWSAKWALNRSFQEIHDDVKGIDKIAPKPHAMMKGLSKTKNPMERIAAISFRDNTILNQHPAAPATEPTDDLYIRFERQTVQGFRDIGAFLFTIKTYFNDCYNLKGEYKTRLIEAFEEKNPDVYSSRFISVNAERVLKRLKP